jgi:hypothetical protein
MEDATVILLLVAHPHGYTIPPPQGLADHAYVLMTNHVHLLGTPERAAVTGEYLL